MLPVFGSLAVASFFVLPGYVFLLTSGAWRKRRTDMHVLLQSIAFSVIFQLLMPLLARLSPRLVLKQVLNEIFISNAASAAISKLRTANILFCHTCSHYKELLALYFTGVNSIVVYAIEILLLSAILGLAARPFLEFVTEEFTVNNCDKLGNCVKVNIVHRLLKLIKPKKAHNQ